MWLRLARKDWVLNRRAVILNAGIFSVFLIVMAHDAKFPPAEYLLMSALLFSFLIPTLLAREDKFRAAAFTCSLPATRRSIVRARYASGLVVGLLGIALAVLLGLGLPTSDFTARSLLAPARIETGVATLVVAMSLLVPFTFRFGMLGILVFLVVMQVLGLALFAVARYAGVTDGVGDAIGGIVSFLSRAHAELGEGLFAAALILALALLFAASCRLSERIFAKRDL